MSCLPGQKLLNLVEACIRDRKLFGFDDDILIGISGGKDSLALLDCLFRLGFSRLHSIHIKTEPESPTPFASFCSERSDFTIINTDILQQIRSSNRNNSCYICSRLRRRALSDYAVSRNLPILALGHHQNDMIETFLLNLFFQRELSTMLPMQDLFAGKLKLVRPFYDIAEAEISRYASRLKLPVAHWNCGFEQDSRRSWIRQQLGIWQKENPQIRLNANLSKAILNPNPEFLPPRTSDNH